MKIGARRNRSKPRNAAAAVARTLLGLPAAADELSEPAILGDAML